MKHKTSEIEIIYRPMKNNMHQIVNRRQAYKILVGNWNNDTGNIFEEFKILLLDSSSQVLGVLSMFNGGTKTCSDKIPFLFSLVLKSFAKAIVTCHHNPLDTKQLNGNESVIYDKITELSEVYKIKYLDNIIITENSKNSRIYEGFQC